MIRFGFTLIALVIFHSMEPAFADTGCPDPDLLSDLIRGCVDVEGVSLTGSKWAAKQVRGKGAKQVACKTPKASALKPMYDLVRGYLTLRNGETPDGGLLYGHRAFPDGPATVSGDRFGMPYTLRLNFHGAQLKGRATMVIKGMGTCEYDIHRESTTLSFSNTKGRVVKLEHFTPGYRAFLLERCDSGVISNLICDRPFSSMSDEKKYCGLDGKSVRTPIDTFCDGKKIDKYVTNKDGRRIFEEYLYDRHAVSLVKTAQPIYEKDSDRFPVKEVIEVKRQGNPQLLFRYFLKEVKPIDSLERYSTEGKLLVEAKFTSDGSLISASERYANDRLRMEVKAATNKNTYRLSYFDIDGKKQFEGEVRAFDQCGRENFAFPSSGNDPELNKLIDTISTSTESMKSVMMVCTSKDEEMKKLCPLEKSRPLVIIWDADSFMYQCFQKTS